jgi:hypothetical protein
MDSAHLPERQNLGAGGIGWRPTTTVLLTSTAFLVGLASAVVMLVIFGVGERGTASALRLTARWSFLLFWSAYVGGAIAWLWPRFNGLARHGRELGLSYASAQLIHVGLVFWIIHVATGPSGAMVFFWIGIFCTYLLALFSLPRLREALDPRLWRILRTIAMEYIAIAFTADFINLHSHELGKLSHLPFALIACRRSRPAFGRVLGSKIRTIRRKSRLKNRESFCFRSIPNVSRRSPSRLAGIALCCSYCGSLGR